MNALDRFTVDVIFETCSKGHPLTGQNVVVRTKEGGKRRCLTCRREYQKARRKTAEYKAKHNAYQRARYDPVKERARKAARKEMSQ